MSGVNKVILVGRLGSNPETKEFSDSKVCNFSMATSKKFKDEEKTEWHKVSVWGKLADVCSTYLEKGRQVYVEGELRTRSWETEQGEKRYSTEVVANTVQFLGGKDEVKNHAPQESSL